MPVCRRSADLLPLLATLRTDTEFADLLGVVARVQFLATRRTGQTLVGVLLQVACAQPLSD